MLGELLPVFDRLVLTRCTNPRALSPATLASLVEQLGGPEVETVPESRRALRRAREIAGAEGAVAATGSIYLVGDLVREKGAIRASSM
jgi:folylpolyglutamate synthase/dihydropteroate synthase